MEDEKKDTVISARTDCVCVPALECVSGWKRFLFSLVCIINCGCHFCLIAFVKHSFIYKTCSQRNTFRNREVFCHRYINIQWQYDAPKHPLLRKQATFIFMFIHLADAFIRSVLQMRNTTSYSSWWGKNTVQQHLCLAS